MAQAFTRDPMDDARIVGFLEDVERSIVIELLHQTSVLLSDGSEDASSPDDDAGGAGSSGEDALFASLSASMKEREAPTDPALRRLLPDGVKGDDDAAAEFRRLTETSLRERKLSNLDVAMRAFERGFVDDEQAAAIADDVYDRVDDPGARSQRGSDTSGAAGRFDGEPAHEADDIDDLRAQDNLDGLDDGAREVVLDEGEARAVMMALTDVRLVLAERLGVRTDEEADALTERVEAGLAPESPEELLAAYYDFLTWLAESVTLAVMRQA